MATPTRNPSWFQTCFDRLIDVEKGFQKDPADPGNWTGGARGVGKLKGTKYGIAANTYPDLDIANLTLEEAKALYRRDWWAKISAEELPNAVVYQLWDMAVNCSMPRAVMALQRSVGVADDGRLGPITVAAVNAADRNDVLMGFNAERIDFHRRLTSFREYGSGWMGRIAQNLRYAMQDN